MKQPFTVWEKTRTYNGKKIKYFQYSISEASGLPESVYKKHQRKTVKARNKSEATQKTFDLINELKNNSSSQAISGSFEDYTKNYMISGKCHYQSFVRSEGKVLNETYMNEYRKIYENHVISDLILSGTLMKEISHGDLLRYRERLVHKLGVCSTARKAFKIVKQNISYAARMGDIPYDPGAGMGDIKDKPKEKGVFSMDEIRVLFPQEGIGEWQTKQAFLAFLLVYSCGLRKGELLGLRWGSVLFDRSAILIVEAVNDKEHTIGDPKKGKRRGCPVPSFTMNKLKEWKKETKFPEPDNFVFCYQKRFRGKLGGSHFSGTWWSKNFRWPLERLNIDYASRNITPHSLRHTANTQLLDKGYSRDKIRETLGWSSSGVQDIYTHGDAMDHSGQADLIDSILSQE
ncbi:MAG: site-specific integrase [Spirochaetales bacterium]|nr:site-specific integrase [Spirochaetales bacterium]